MDARLNKQKYKHIHKQIVQIMVKPIMKDEDITKKEGNYFPEKHYTNIIKKDCDVYYLDNNQKKLLLKFRKRVIPQQQCKTAYQNLYQAAQKRNRNRGSASGMVKKSKLPKYASNIIKKDKYRVFYKDNQGRTKKDNISNIAMSNIIGYYDAPDRNTLDTVVDKRTKKISPTKMCRTTAFTQKEVSKWNNVLPYLKSADQCFKKLVPSRHQTQLTRCRKNPKYQIGNTAFSTITINYNWRTACHQDRGDLPEGFGNLLVLEKDKCVDYPVQSYQGGYIGFPKYGVAVDVRQGDFLAMDVHQYHSNTPIKVGKMCNSESNIKNNRQKTKKHGRLSIVCYLRKNMLKCAKK